MPVTIDDQDGPDVGGMVDRRWPTAPVSIRRRKVGKYHRQPSVG